MAVRSIKLIAAASVSLLQFVVTSTVTIPRRRMRSKHGPVRLCLSGKKKAHGRDSKTGSTPLSVAEAPSTKSQRAMPAMASVTTTRTPRTLSASFLDFGTGLLIRGLFAGGKGVG